MNLNLIRAVLKCPYRHISVRAYYIMSLFVHVGIIIHFIIYDMSQTFTAVTHSKSNAGVGNFDDGKGHYFNSHSRGPQYS